MEIAGIGIISAFLAGLVSFLSPCVLPLVPGYVSYVAGQSLEDITNSMTGRQRVVVVGLSISFVLGFSFVFVALGASATFIGGLMRTFLFQANYIAGGIIVAFGLYMMGLLRLGWLGRDLRFFPTFQGGRPIGAFLMGIAFAFGWTPCVGPILGGILTLSASSLSVADGVILLSIYSAGLAVPFVMVAIFTNQFLRRASIMKRIGRKMQTVAGGILVLMGIGMATGYITSASTWMLNTFPILQSLVI